MERIGRAARRTAQRARRPLLSRLTGNAAILAAIRKTSIPGRIVHGHEHSRIDHDAISFAVRIVSSFAWSRSNTSSFGIPLPSANSRRDISMSRESSMRSKRLSRDSASTRYEAARPFCVIRTGRCVSRTRLMYMERLLRHSENGTTSSEGRQRWIGRSFVLGMMDSPLVSTPKIVQNFGMSINGEKGRNWWGSLFIRRIAPMVGRPAPWPPRIVPMVGRARRARRKDTPIARQWRPNCGVRGAPALPIQQAARRVDAPGNGSCEHSNLLMEAVASRESRRLGGSQGIDRMAVVVFTRLSNHRRRLHPRATSGN